MSFGAPHSRTPRPTTIDMSADPSSTLTRLHDSLERDGLAVRSRDALARVALALLEHPGDPVIGQIVRRDGAEAAFCLAVETHRAQEATGSPQGRHGPVWAQMLAEAVKVSLRATESLGFGYMTPLDGSWPAGLVELGDSAPLGLWVAGEASLLASHELTGVLGGRTSSVYGRARAVQLAVDLARGGRTILTAASTGTDVDVIDAAVAAGGRVAVILAGGVDRFDAPATEVLQRVIAAGGAIASEAAPGSRPNRHGLIARNRLVAAMATELVVLEAGRHSPAVTTARLGSDLGRDVTVLAGAVGPASAGSRDLIDELTGRSITGAAELLAAE